MSNVRRLRRSLRIVQPPPVTPTEFHPMEGLSVTCTVHGLLARAVGAHDPEADTVELINGIMYEHQVTGGCMGGLIEVRPDMTLMAVKP